MGADSIIPAFGQSNHVDHADSTKLEIPGKEKMGQVEVTVMNYVILKIWVLHMLISFLRMS